jgi:hypothetical protein
MNGSVSLHLHLSLQGLQQLLAWYNVRDTLFGHNSSKRDIKKALELASVCEHPNAVWLTKLFAGSDVASREEARQVFLGSENDTRAFCFAGFLVRDFDQIRRAADLGDAFAQAWMAMRTVGEERFQWAEKSAVQRERDGFLELGYCYRDAVACKKDLERAKDNFLVAFEIGLLNAMICVGNLLGKDEPQRFFWFGRAASSGLSFSFLNEMRHQIRNFNSGTGHAKVVFAIGRALKGHINNEARTLFGSTWNFDAHIGPAKQALQFYEFQLQSCRKAVDSWTIVGLRNKVVRDIRKMIGKMVWDGRVEAKY